MARKTDTPVVLIEWYDFTKWLLERIDNFPKNQRSIFGQRLADHALEILELLVEAAYGHRKSDLLSAANRKIEMLRWLLRLAQDRVTRLYGSFSPCSSVGSSKIPLLAGPARGRMQRCGGRRNLPSASSMPSSAMSRKTFPV